MKPKYIYIAGVGHSGSTILDMALGVHSKIVGLGEIYPYLIRNKEERIKQLKRSTCSCMKQGNECDFWSTTVDISKHERGNVKSYLELHNYFSNKFGKETILLDSSKNSYPVLKEIAKHFDLKIVFLTRDYRSWIYSRVSRLKKPVLFFAAQWFAENKKIGYRLNKMNLNFIRVGYEELALYPQKILAEICNYIDVDFDERMTVPANTSSHIINGNISRADPLKRKTIKYDMRWMTSLRIILWHPFLFPLHFMNKKQVYSNFLSEESGTEPLNVFSDKRKKELNIN